MLKFFKRSKRSGADSEDEKLGKSKKSISTESNLNEVPSTTMSYQNVAQNLNTIDRAQLPAMPNNEFNRNLDELNSSNQFDRNDSIGGRVSNSKFRFYDIMAKGKNRRGAANQPNKNKNQSSSVKTTPDARPHFLPTPAKQQELNSRNTSLPWINEQQQKSSTQELKKSRFGTPFRITAKDNNSNGGGASESVVENFTKPNVKCELQLDKLKPIQNVNKFSYSKQNDQRLDERAHKNSNSITSNIVGCALARASAPMACAGAGATTILDQCVGYGDARTAEFSSTDKNNHENENTKTFNNTVQNNIPNEFKIITMKVEPTKRLEQTHSVTEQQVECTSVADLVKDIVLEKYKRNKSTISNVHHPVTRKPESILSVNSRPSTVNLINGSVLNKANGPGEMGQQQSGKVPIVDDDIKSVPYSGSTVVNDLNRSQVINTVETADNSSPKMTRPMPQQIWMKSKSLSSESESSSDAIDEIVSTTDEKDDIYYEANDSSSSTTEATNTVSNTKSCELNSSEIRIEKLNENILNNNLNHSNVNNILSGKTINLNSAVLKNLDLESTEDEVTMIDEDTELEYEEVDDDTVNSDGIESEENVTEEEVETVEEEEETEEETETETESSSNEIGNEKSSIETKLSVKPTKVSNVEEDDEDEETEETEEEEESSEELTESPVNVTPIVKSVLTKESSSEEESEQTTEEDATEEDASTTEDDGDGDEEESNLPTVLNESMRCNNESNSNDYSSTNNATNQPNDNSNFIPKVICINSIDIRNLSEEENEDEDNESGADENSTSINSFSDNNTFNNKYATTNKLITNENNCTITPIIDYLDVNANDSPDSGIDELIDGRDTSPSINRNNHIVHEIKIEQLADEDTFNSGFKLERDLHVNGNFQNYECKTTDSLLDRNGIAGIDNSCKTNVYFSDFSQYDKDIDCVFKDVDEVTEINTIINGNVRTAMPDENWDGWDTDEDEIEQLKMKQKHLQKMRNVRFMEKDIIFRLPDLVESTGYSGDEVYDDREEDSDQGGLDSSQEESDVTDEDNDNEMDRDNDEEESVSSLGDDNEDAQQSSAKDMNENLKKELLNQEVRLTAQLEEAEKQAYDAQSKANELLFKIDDLDRNLSIKSSIIERLQAELKAAFQESECVKKKLKYQEDELNVLRSQFSEREDALNSKYDELEAEHEELKKKFENIKKMASSLHTQLAEAQDKADQERIEKERLLVQLANEQLTAKEALEKAGAEREQIELKWQKEFENLRTTNSEREEHLLEDCEWKLRTMEKKCKEKMDAVELDKKTAVGKLMALETEASQRKNEVQHLKTYEAEVAQLRGLTNDQRESIKSLQNQLSELKSELEYANARVEAELENVRKVKQQCKNELSDKDRQMINKIEEARGDVAVIWEDRLLEEMSRLKMELEQVAAEDRKETLDKLNLEHINEITELTNKFNKKEKQLQDDLHDLRKQLSEQRLVIESAQTKADTALVQTRMTLERADRDHQLEMDREVARREQLTDSLRDEFEKERHDMEDQFCERLKQVKEEFSTEIENVKDELVKKHKKKIEESKKHYMAEKEAALYDLENKYKLKLEQAESKIKEMEIEQKRTFKDLESIHTIERSSLQSRDLQNAQEIETLHRKCRCLTKLFEEMRMRYERRDPRPEDLREIAELKNRVEIQDRDLTNLTERLRELQMGQQQQNGSTTNLNVTPRKGKNRKNHDKSNLSKLNCDVIYEENEERESSPNTNTPTAITTSQGGGEGGS